MRARSAHARSRSAATPRSPSVGTSGTRPAYPLGANEKFLIRAVTKAPGILDSVPFKVSRRFLVFRLGGSRDKGAAIELRVPAKAAERAGLKALDKPDAEGYVAVKIARPDRIGRAQGDRLGPRAGRRQDAGRQVAKVRLRLDAGAKAPRRLLVDFIRLDAQAAGAVPPAGVGLGGHPLPPHGPGGVRRAAARPHARPRRGPRARAWTSTATCTRTCSSPPRSILDGGRYNDGSLATQRLDDPAHARARRRARASAAGPRSTTRPTSRPTRTGSAAPTTAASG